MSVLIVVQQYLTEEGLKALPEIFREHRRRAAGFEGFIALRRLTPTTDAEVGQVTMIAEFTSESTLLRWRNSKEHQEVGEMYGQYRRKPPEPVFYRVEE